MTAKKENATRVELNETELEFVSGGADSLQGLLAETQSSCTMDTTTVKCPNCGNGVMWEDENDETVFHCPRCKTTVTGVVHIKETYGLFGQLK